MKRLSYEESCKRLQKDYLDKGVIPPMPKSLPKQNGEEPLGISFFRTFVGDGDNLDNLTLPRTFFSRSQIENATFKNCDFTQSNFSENDFVNVDFEDANLSNSDIKNSIFKKVSFKKANLTGCNFKNSSFEDCDFTMANVTNAIITRAQARKMKLSYEQKSLAILRWF